MRLDSVFTCPIHSVIAEKAGGKCPICGRTLGEVTVSVAWRCGGSATDLIEPQKCQDGTQAVRVQKTLAHGNHNPQHGGQFFMGSDYWHHVEGVYPSPGVFRPRRDEGRDQPADLRDPRSDSGEADAVGRGSLP
jgi:hypothetical protein